MDEDRASAAREEARRRHLATAERVPCLCDECNGALQEPRTARSHMKRQRQRKAAIGLPRAANVIPVADSHSPQRRPARAALGNITNSPLPRSLPPSPVREPSPVRAPPSSPARSVRSYRPDSPEPALPSSPAPSLHASRPVSRHPSPEIQRIPPNQIRNDLDGPLSDFAIPEHEHIGDLNQYFARLLDGDDAEVEGAGDPFFDNPPVDDHGESDHGSDDGLYDENYGLPVPEERPGEQRLWDLEEDDLDFGPGGDPDDPVDDEPDFAAFNEPDLIRNAYVDAYVQKTRFRATHDALKHQLKASRRNLSSNPNIPPEAIAKMAQTIVTAERRLGLSTVDIITTYTLCPTCKRRYNPAYIANTARDTCLKAGCTGILFIDKVLNSGERRRVPHLTYPVASLVAWLRRVFSQPGMAELVQNNPDEPNDDAAPVSPEEWLANLDLNRPLGDLPDGYDWDAREAGLRRVVDPDGDAEGGDLVYDQSTLDQPLRFSSLLYALSLSMNTDWFQSNKEGNYSVGAAYFVINNLPRHLRFLRENICLAVVFPGPNEPNDYALDQMLEPIVQELLELQSGVEIRVRKGDPPVYEDHIVHADLCYHIADLIARIKLGGGAGVASELNFCLYCRTRLSALSVPAGFVRRGFPYRDPHEDLQNCYFWRSLESKEDRRLSFEETGNRFTILHTLPGWHTATRSPPDAMHLLYLGGVNWILKQVIVGPNLLAPRQPGAENPIDIFNTALDDIWFPYNVGRLPPKASNTLGQTSARVKADQLKLMSKVMFIPLYMAMRDDGGEISAIEVPRGNAASSGGKHQHQRAKLLQRARAKHYAAIGQPQLAPTLPECFPSRSLPRHYKQILRFCIAVCTLDSKSITPNAISFAQSLLETLCIEYTRMNVPLSPNFHYMLHLEESMLRTGSLYNTHVWPMERANGMVSRINHNGRGKGVLEGTMMRGWWEHASLRNLIRRFQSIPNRTPADDAIIDDLLMALRGGPEHAQQRGTLMAYIAQSRTAYTRLHGIQEPTRLSTQSRPFKLDNQLYPLVVAFCDRMWPNAGIFGPGAVRQLYLPPDGAVRNFSYVEQDGLRYGSYLHTFGKRACYGFTNPRLPVRIERILYIEFPDRPEMRTICAIVRRFQVPQIEPVYPWSTWQENLGVSHWEYGALSDLVAIPVADFAGLFARATVPDNFGQPYWVAIAMSCSEPVEHEHDDEEEDDQWV